MALFLAKTGWDRPKKRQKNFSPEFRSYPTRERKFQKKTAKKFKQLKNLFLALFFAKTGWVGPRKWEKNFSPEFHSYSIRARKLQKSSEKIQKIEKHHSGIIFIQTGIRYGEKVRKKILVLISVPTQPELKNSKKK